VIAYLNHTRITKKGDTYYLQVRTKECAEMLLERANVIGISLEVEVLGVPNLTSKEKILEHFTNKNPLFKELVTSLGLKLK
jgi:hypothetical protein